MLNVCGAIQLEDGSSIAYGSLQRTPRNPILPWISGVDTSGAIVWERTFSIDVGERGGSGGIIAAFMLSDDMPAFLISGRIYDEQGGNPEPQFVLATADSQIIWRYSYDNDEDHAFEYKGMLVLQDGFLLMLRKGTVSNGNEFPDFPIDFTQLIRMNEAGEVLWIQEYHRGAELVGLNPKGLVPGIEGGFIIMSYVQHGILGEENPPPDELLFTSVAAEGELIWERSYEDFGGLMIMKIDELEWAVLSVVSRQDDEGNTVSGPRIMRFDEWGNALFWSEPIERVGYTRIRGWTRAADGGYLIVCNNLELIRMDVWGDCMYQDAPLGDSVRLHPSNPFTVNRTSDDGYLMAGHFTEPDSLENCLIRFDPEEVVNSAMVNILTPAHFTLSTAYPSPFNSMAFVDFTTPFTGQIRASLVDMNGRQWSKWTVSQAQPGAGRFVITGAGLASGQYWLKVEQGGRMAGLKVVLIK
jgi:hypothetical protein